ncbi:MAG: murein L,D-transpeptidase family protein [Gammaproteobacteria bacterium]
MRIINGQQILSILSALFLLMPGAVMANKTIKADFVLVSKSERTMYLMNQGRIIKRYPISLGENPVGHKRQLNDKRTPEGRYTLDWRNPESKYHKSIHISYPSREDMARARHNGVNPGGSIMIHGVVNDTVSEIMSELNKRPDWTDGCIAVTNKEMDEIWLAVKNGTPIEILP